MANKEAKEIEKISSWYLLDFLQLLSYSIEEAEVDEEEDKYQDMLRKAKKR